MLEMECVEYMMHYNSYVETLLRLRCFCEFALHCAQGIWGADGFGLLAPCWVTAYLGADGVKEECWSRTIWGTWASTCVASLVFY